MGPGVNWVLGSLPGERTRCKTLSSVAAELQVALGDVTAQGIISNDREGKADYP